MFVACHLCVVLDLFRPSLLVSAESAICRRHRTFVRPLVLWIILIIMTLFVIHNVVHISKQECIPVGCVPYGREGGRGSLCRGGPCPGGSLSGSLCPEGLCPEGLCLKGSLSRRSLSKGLCLGGLCLSGSLSKGGQTGW